jgi:hypothetical protein
VKEDLVDHRQFQDTAAKILEIGAVVEKLPEQVRFQAFDLLAAYASATGTQHRGKETASPKPHSSPSQNSDPAEFFGKFNADKPADNVKLVAAYLYREYGAQPFSVDEVKELADSVGVTMPARVDMTLVAALSEGKKLFTRCGRGQFKPSVHGEIFMKSTYQVTKGKRAKENPSE